MTESAVQLFEQITDPQLLVRRINIVANRAVSFREQMEQPVFEQLDLFTDYEKQRRDEAQAKEDMEREKKMQEAMLSIKKKFAEMPSSRDEPGGGGDRGGEKPADWRSQSVRREA